MSDEIKVGPLLRDFAGIEVKVEKRDGGGARLSFSAASEAPVERFFGTEVLAIDERAIRMERFSRGAAPLLFNHNWDDPVGMITDARVQGGRLMVDAKMFATERAKEIEAMVDGGLRNVSIGYQIHAIEEDAKRGIFRATDWEPLEVSIVTVPADSTVGIGHRITQYPCGSSARQMFNPRHPPHHMEANKWLTAPPPPRAQLRTSGSSTTSTRPSTNPAARRPSASWRRPTTSTMSGRSSTGSARASRGTTSPTTS
jgi:HK97 family phage prohead protease